MINKALKTEAAISIDVSPQEIAGTKIQLNIEKLREKGQWVGYKMKDLPEGIDQDTIKTLFNELNKRVHSLTAEEQEAVYNEIGNCCGHTLTFLENNLIDKPFLTGLMKRSPNPEETISDTQFQLFTLLRAVLDADASVPNGEKLSPREYLLLKVSESIQYCSTGQKDNLANYYNALSEKYKRGSSAQETKEAKAEMFVDNCVQKAINDVLTNERLLKELTNNKNAQPSHNTEFLRNRYHYQIGLKHRVSFDQHSSVLSDELLEKKLEEVVGRFFESFTPSLLVKQVIIGSEEVLKANQFLGLEALVVRSEGPITEHEQFFVFEEETMAPLRLTERGALALLKSTGYFI